MNIKGNKGLESDFYGTKRIFSNNLAAHVADGANTDQEATGSPSHPANQRGRANLGRSAASVAEGEKNEQEGFEAAEAFQRHDDAPPQQRDRSDDPEIMDNFEFMTKTVKKLQERVTEIEKLIASTRKNLERQKVELKDRIKKEQ